MNNHKTIGVLVRSLSSGGTERVAARLSVLWASAGFKIIFITRDSPSNNDFEHICEKRIQVLADNHSAEELKKVIILNQVDIFIYNGGWNTETFNREVDAIKSIGTKLFVLLHHSFTNWAFFFSNAGDFYKDDVLNKIDRVICVNPVQALWWKNRGAVVSYIPNPPTFAPAEEISYNHASKTLIWIGRPKDIGKRVDEAINIFICVKKTIADAQLIILGDVDAAQQKILINKLSEAKIKRGVLFYGYCPEITKYLKRSCVHMLTSVVEVSSPMVVAEAASYGVPTVMYDLPVATEAHQRNGIITIPDGDRELFVNTLNKILLERQFAEKLSASAKSWADRFNENKIISKWKVVFSHLRKKNSSHSGSATYSIDICEFETIEMYRRLTNEIYRSQKYFIFNHFWKLKFFSRWINRIWFVRQKVATCYTSFLDTIR